MIKLKFKRTPKDEQRTTEEGAENGTYSPTATKETDRSNFCSRSTSSPQALQFSPKPNGRPIRSQRAPMKEIITLDDPEELEEVGHGGTEGLTPSLS